MNLLRAVVRMIKLLAEKEEMEDIEIREVLQITFGFSHFLYLFLVIGLFLVRRRDSGKGDSVEFPWSFIRNL